MVINCIGLSPFLFDFSQFRSMSIKSDVWLRRMAEEHEMITPFLSELVRETNGNKIISAGSSSYGYDMRLADDGFKIFSSVHAKEIDPKRFDEQYSLIEPDLHAADDGARYYLLPPHHYGLGVTVETFNMPRNVTGIALGKSTYARGTAREHNAARGRLEGPTSRRDRQSCKPAAACLC